MRATKSFDSFMHFYMFVQVGSLSETKVTTSEATFIRSFVCMDPQVIEEIVPFSKVFVTIFLIAL